MKTVQQKLNDSSLRSPLTILLFSIKHGWNPVIRQALLFLLMLVSPQFARSQSLNGTTGLVTVPTAGILSDGQVRFGANYVDKEYNVRTHEHNQHRYFITLGYLPGLEVSLRLTRNHMVRLEHSQEQQWPGDRGASVRLRVSGEKGYRPSLVLGAHDFLSAFGGSEAVWFNALYLAASKNIQYGEGPVAFGFNLGYGTDWMKATHHEFVGVFGGLSMEYGDIATLLLEYDTKKVNGGMRFEFFRHVQILLALLNMDSFSAGASVSFSL